MQLRAQVGVFSAQPPLFEGDVSSCNSSSNWNGLLMNPSAPSRVTSTASRTVPYPVMTMAMMSGISRERLVEHLTAVDARQPKVRDQNVEGKIVQSSDGILAGACLLDLVSMFGELFGDDITERQFIVDEQEMLRSGLRH